MSHLTAIRLITAEWVFLLLPLYTLIGTQNHNRSCRTGLTADHSTMLQDPQVEGEAAARTKSSNEAGPRSYPVFVQANIQIQSQLGNASRNASHAD